MYILLEIVEGEPLKPRLFVDLDQAVKVFEVCAEENLAHEEASEIGLRFAGDDIYSVELFEAEVSSGY
jgi:hypothetical protein